MPTLRDAPGRIVPGEPSIGSITGVVGAAGGVAATASAFTGTGVRHALAVGCPTTLSH
ncbi:hypothetical protein ABT147_12330 [Streptomyces sp. NPDC001868]|uniref:hypothetical protein n=1 Tax=Streptomyces sp. NPDC001868 TaxID=3154401 RepID=UPI0033254035